jgi:CubicO group peptidase (beta-lactamase class C family)
MTSGLDCDDDNAKSPGSEDVVQDGNERNWYRATLALATQVEPGSRGVYCTMGINLLGALLEQRSSPEKGLPVWIPELFVTRLARPLQMSHYILNLMPSGQGYLGGGLRLLPRDMAKLGQLYLGKGTWNGQRILSPSWTAQATARHASLSTPDDYGLGFWRTTFLYDRASYPAFYASGNGGQLIITIPSLEAVIVFTAGNYNNRRTWGRLFDDYIPRYVIPSLLGRP